MSKRFMTVGVVALLLLLFSTSAIFAQSKGVIYYLSPNQFDEMQTAATVMLKEAVEAAGYTCRTVTAGNEDVSLQLNQLDNAISQNPAAIIIAAVDGVAVSDGVARARAAGIPVFSFNRVISETFVDFHSVAGCKMMGIRAGHEIARLLEEKYGTVKGTVLDIMGDPSDSYTTLIEEGFREVMEQYPEVIIETKIAQAWEASRAADIAEDWLTAHPDTDLIFPHSDHLTAAVVAVLQNKGYEKGDIILVSCTGMPMGLELIREGWISCIVEEPVSAQAEGIAMFLDDIIAGNTPELGPYLVKGIEAELIEMPYGPELRITGNVIDINNVDDPIWWGNQVGN